VNSAKTCNNRLNIFWSLPPHCGERKKDIPELVTIICGTFAASMDKVIETIPEETISSRLTIRAGQYSRVVSKPRGAGVILSTDGVFERVSSKSRTRAGGDFKSHA